MSMDFLYLLLLILIIGSCASPETPTPSPVTRTRYITKTDYYNTPFINSAETTKLEFNQSESEVLNLIGIPLFVSYGDQNKIQWVYEVRTIKVQSTIYGMGGPLFDNAPSKKHDNYIHDEAIHRIILTFTNGKLTSWFKYDDEN